MGKTALAWVMQGGRPDLCTRETLLLYRWQAFWFEKNLEVLRKLCAPEEEVRPPVLLLGLWRSGTTFLHLLLAANRRLLAPTTWQCMNSSLHALIDAPDKLRYVERPMDAVRVRADTPHEDEFALLARGVPSVYRAFFDPRRLSEQQKWLDPQTWMNCPRTEWWPQWRSFLASVQREREGRLLLKSPNHTFRVDAICRELPESSIVWIVRDPREVFFSNWKMWKAMFQRYALWKVSEEDLERELDRFLVLAFRLSTEALARAAARMERGRMVVVRFENLLADPTGVVRGVEERLGLGEGLRERDAVYGMDPARYEGQRLPAAMEEMLPWVRQAYRSAVESHGL